MGVVRLVGVLLLIEEVGPGSAWAAAPAGRGARVALVIGNAEYQHERKLTNPVNDAELLGRVLESFQQQARGMDAVAFDL